MGNFFSEIGDFVSDAVDWAGDKAGDVVDWVGDTAGDVMDFAGAAASTVGSFIPGPIGTILQVGGGVMEWISGSEAEEAKKDAAKRQAEEYQRVAEANRAISLYDAEVARRSGLQQRFEHDAQAGFLYRDLKNLMSTQRTRFAKSGVSIGEGSPVDVIEETLVNGAKDIMNLKYKGDTAKAKADSLANRYIALADQGLRDAAAQASLVEAAASDAVESMRWEKYGSAAKKIYNIGKEYEWI